MKNKKSILAIIITVSVLLVIFSGCSESVNSEIPNDSENTTQPAFTEEEVSYSLIPFGFKIDGVDSQEELAEEILEHIEIAEKISEGEGEYWLYEDYWLYCGSSIADITEFYVPAVEFEGFELFSVIVLESVFLFNYMPVNLDGLDGVGGVLLDDEGVPYFFCTSVGIRLSIDRTDCDSEPIETIEQFAELFNVDDLVIREGFIYVESIRLIAGFMGGTQFDMNVPDALNDFETLRDLATQVVNSAELVVVGE